MSQTAELDLASIVVASVKAALVVHAILCTSILLHVTDDTYILNGSVHCDAVKIIAWHCMAWQ